MSLFKNFKWLTGLIILVAILLIGILVTKVLVLDKLSLSELETECFTTNWPGLYDNPLERFGIGVLGKTVVTKKSADILYTDSYTLFAIPVSRAVFQCSDGQAFKLPKTEAAIKQIITEAQSCQVKSDCVPVATKCPFGCDLYVNHTKAWQVETLIDSYDSNCVYSCMAIAGYDCVDNRCAVTLAPADEQDSKLQFIYGLGTYHEVPFVGNKKTFNSDKFNLSFQYPANYLLFENASDPSIGRDYYSVTLHEDGEFIRQAMAGVETATEWPPAIHLIFYREENKSLSLKDWVKGNKIISNYDPEMPADNLLIPTTVAGLPAVSYLVYGLYSMSVTVFLYDGWVVVASVDSLDSENNHLNQDFRLILDSIQLAR